MEDIIKSKDINQVKELDANNFQANNLPPTKNQRFNATSVFIKEEVYLLGGYETPGTIVKSIEKYSIVTKSWVKVIDIPDECKYFCVCADMDKIYLCGRSCTLLDTRTLKWKEAEKSD